MKLSSLILAVTSIALSSNILAEDSNQLSRIGIQGAIATGGSLSIGLVRYTPSTEIGFSISGSVNNADNKTEIVTPVFFAGKRISLLDHTYFAYGLNLVANFGKDNGDHIDSDYEIGPYISIEQILTQHVLLSGWIDPYSYRYKKIGGDPVSNQQFFASGGLALNYLF